MKLLTKEILKKLPALYTTEDVPADEKIAVVKFFFPMGRYTFYAVEYSPEDKLFFGFCVSALGADCEWGYTSLTELEETVVRGLKMERDLYFKPTKMGDILQHS